MISIETNIADFKKSFQISDCRNKVFTIFGAARKIAEISKK